VNPVEQTLLLVSSALILVTTLVIFVVQYIRGRGKDR
jgi:hypothetical protein